MTRDTMPPLELPGLTLADGRWGEIYRLYFGRARLGISLKQGDMFYVDEW